MAEPARPPRRRLRCCLFAAGVVVLGAGLAFVALQRPRPVGPVGPEADALARRMIDAVDGAAWARTGAVRWTFVGYYSHLWDRQRGLARVRWSDVEVLLRAGSPVGRAWRAGERMRGEDEQKLVNKAHEVFLNDSFWLNAVAKAFDPGTQRARVGDAALLVSYTSGGSTPGDAYLWELDASGRPTAWRMWVSIVPMKGLRASWTDWTQLSTGAWIAREHRIAGLPLRLTDVAGAATLAELEPGADPFAPLLAPE